MTIFRALLLCVAAGCAGCGDDAATPTAPTSTAPTVQTKIFSGVMVQKSTRFFSYTVTTAGNVSAMLASLSVAGTTSPAGNHLSMGLGVPAGTGCSVSSVLSVAPSLIPQITQSASPGTYCVSITDADGLPAPMNFVVRLVHP